MERTPEVEQQLEEVKELDILSNLEQIKHGIEATIVKIYKGRLIDLISMVRDIDKLRENGKEWLRAYADEPYILMVAKLEDGTEVQLLFHLTYNENGKLVKFVKKYGNPKVGTKILVRYNPEKFRFDVVL